MFERLAQAHAKEQQRRQGTDGIASADDVGLALEVKHRKRDPDDAARSLIERPDLAERMRQLEGKTSRAAKDHFDPHLLEEHMRKQGILRDNWVIHQHRAQMDPLYALWFCPAATVAILDQETGEETTMLFIDKVVQDCMQFMELRCGDVVSKCEEIQIAFEHLRHTKDTRIKLFAICFFMTWADEIRDHLAHLYTDKGFRKRSDFMRAAKVIAELCEVVWRASSVHRVNINQVVHDVLRSGIAAYIRPPVHMTQAQ